MSYTGNVTAVLGRGFAGEFGRKGSVSDVTLYNHKLGDCVLSFVEPSSYPDKVQSLVSSLNMADQVLLKVDAVNAEFGEEVIALDALDMKKGYLVFGAGVSRDAVSKLISGTVVAGYEVVEEQVMGIKERLARLEVRAQGGVVVQVDHTFPVKGVGTVVLGVVKQGVVKKHDNLMVYPGARKVLVKSIQVHDIDVDSATVGSRVGLALKDVKPEDIPRGVLLAEEGAVKTVSGFEGEVTVSKYSPRKVAEGDAFMVNACLNYVPVKVTGGSVQPGARGRVKLTFEKELPLFGGRIALLDPGLKPPRVFGFAQV